MSRFPKNPDDKFADSPYIEQSLYSFHDSAKQAGGCAKRRRSLLALVEVGQGKGLHREQGRGRARNGEDSAFW